MFARSDLSQLIATAPDRGISIYMPTHIRGEETRQDPIRLRNLVAEARDRLTGAGVDKFDAGALVAPATALIENYGFWQHQDQGLALFLGDGQAHRYRVPIPFAEQVFVGPGFYVKPLLPLLAADGAFHLLTITADKVRLFDASRFSLTEDLDADLPRDISEWLGESDYENPVQASPVARPNTGSVDISNAQVYGDSPAEWRKGRLVEFVGKVAAAFDRHAAGHPIPVVVAADPEIAGHFKKQTSLGSWLVGSILLNPEAIDARQLHEAAYNLVRPRFESDCHEAVERLSALLGTNDRRAITTIDDIVRAAYRGQINTLLLTDSAPLWGRYDEETGSVETHSTRADADTDLFESAAVQTLEQGGTVHILDRGHMADVLDGHTSDASTSECTALLRY
ncbi:baeRF3 domain-containing protein [Rhodococcus marinonascens]|uniref:baeRF3 domain-containing protein n=1 Tax=Rhodococcus marinonascens TaxID=38311 RepID=UPI000932E75A|nr:hypothetical protein [Rhodococcus marinonascens]